MVYPYRIDTKEELFRLSELACKENYTIYISTDYGMVDARSVMALFTLLGKDVNLVAPDHADAEKFHRFIEKL